MSERPTPETNKFRTSLGGMREINQRDRLLIHARRLERERDEARELIDDIWITATSDHRFIMPPSKKQIPQHIEGIIKAYDKAHDDWTPEEIKTLMRERDEARERADTMFAKHADILDQAREQLSAERALADRLAEAANAVIDQWESPNWKITEPTATYMNTLTNTIAAWKEARSE